MSRKVFKYSLTESTVIKVPFGSKFVHFGVQNDEFMVWLEVDEEFPMVERHLAVKGTGHLIPQFAEHLGSVISDPFVWHLYELPRK